MSNAFTDGTRKVIPAVLLYAFHQDRVLMLRSRPKDGLPGKWNGLGGKLDSDETMTEASVREFREESGCPTRAEQWQWLGQLHFPNFKAHKGEDWWVNVLVTDLTTEQAESIPLHDPDQPEGLLEFVPLSKVTALDLWEGDRHFLPLVFERVPFQGTFFYRQNCCVRHELSRLR